jgi:hypothetical protein
MHNPRNLREPVPGQQHVLYPLLLPAQEDNRECWGWTPGTP